MGFPLCCNLCAASCHMQQCCRASGTTVDTSITWQEDHHPIEGCNAHGTVLGWQPCIAAERPTAPTAKREFGLNNTRRKKSPKRRYCTAVIASCIVQIHSVCLLQAMQGTSLPANRREAAQCSCLLWFTSNHQLATHTPTPTPAPRAHPHTPTRTAPHGNKTWHFTK